MASAALVGKWLLHRDASEAKEGLVLLVVAVFLYWLVLLKRRRRDERALGRLPGEDQSQPTGKQALPNGPALTRMR